MLLNTLVFIELRQQSCILIISVFTVREYKNQLVFLLYSSVILLAREGRGDTDQMESAISPTRCNEATIRGNGDFAHNIGVVCQGVQTPAGCNTRHIHVTVSPPSDQMPSIGSCRDGEYNAARVYYLDARECLCVPQPDCPIRRT